MKALISLLGMLPLITANGNLRTLGIDEKSYVDANLQCKEDNDCPQLICKQAPCPFSVCRQNKCVSSTSPARSYPVMPPIKSPITSTGIKCGNSTCSAGQVCCNASCGICTPVGGSCLGGVCIELDSVNDPSRPVVKPRAISSVPLPFPPARTPSVGGVRCGTKLCSSDEVCCNESCGICTKPGGVCNAILCVKQPFNMPQTTPIAKPKTSPFAASTSSPIERLGRCKTDVDCPLPPCARPINGITSRCPIPKCINRQCVVLSPPTTRPLAVPPVRAPISSGEKCGNTICDKSEVCCNESCGICTKPDGFCHKRFCGGRPTIRPPLLGACKEDSDCHVACSLIATIDGKPGQCTKSVCINNKCSNAAPSSPAPIKCGNVMCNSDEYCCNESCGDCINKLSKRLCSNTICRPAVQCRNDLDCKKGTMCNSMGQCEEKPTPTPVLCGKNTCHGGDICCDNFCGTCTKPGMACPLGCKGNDYSASLNENY